MAEDFLITFQGVQDVSDMANDIADKLEGVEDVADDEDELDRWVPEIVVTSDGVEEELEEFMKDVLDKLQTEAINNESDFLSNLP